MENLFCSEQEIVFLKEKASGVVRELVKRHSGIEDIFTHSPDLSSQAWHTVGKEMNDYLVAAVPVEEGNEVIVNVASELSAERGRTITVHILKMDRKTLESYRTDQRETPSGVVADAIFEIRKTDKDNPDSTRDHGLYWTDRDMNGINAQFTSSALTHRVKFDDLSKTIDQISASVRKKAETLLEHNNSVKDIVVRQK